MKSAAAHTDWSPGVSCAQTSQQQTGDDTSGRVVPLPRRIDTFPAAKAVLLDLLISAQSTDLVHAEERGAGLTAFLDSGGQRWYLSLQPVRESA
jgi:hypothetical protein